MKTLEIGGEIFEVIRSKNTVDMIDSLGADYRGRKTLYDFYDNPSAIKERIWDEWLDWASANYPTVQCMYVTSASCFSFTIGAYYYDEETDDEGYIKITKDHNRLYLK